MYRIVGKENLFAVNTVADRSMEVLRILSKEEEEGNTKEVVSINRDYLASITSGYLFLYNAVLDHGIMPSQRSAKHQIFKVH
jgi:hypothetical protein